MMAGWGLGAQRASAMRAWCLPGSRGNQGDQGLQLLLPLRRSTRVTGLKRSLGARRSLDTGGLPLEDHPGERARAAMIEHPVTLDLGCMAPLLLKVAPNGPKCPQASENNGEKASMSPQRRLTVGAQGAAGHGCVWGTWEPWSSFLPTTAWTGHCCPRHQLHLVSQRLPGRVDVVPGG